MSNTPIQTEALAQLRTRIDALDNQLLALLNERARVAEEVGALKRQEGTPFSAPTAWPR
jgi:chorismate mutase/prephenate dehydratase